MLKPEDSVRVRDLVRSTPPVPPRAPGAAIVMIPSEGGGCYCTVMVGVTIVLRRT